MSTAVTSGNLPLFGHGDGLELEYPVRLVPPAAWLAHTPFALWVVGALRPRVIVELGVHTGNSYCAFLQGVQARRLETRCFGIDHWRGDEQAGLYGDEIYEELHAYHDPLYGNFSTLLRCSFDEALAYFSDGRIDLLHIDGFHTYEAVSNDFKSWLPKMSSRGVVLLHDTNVRERGFGVWRLWEAIACRYPSFELTDHHGLGIVYVGSERLCGPIEALLAAKTDADISSIRDYFARLGQSVVDRFSLQELTAKVHAIEAGAPERERGLVEDVRRLIGMAKERYQQLAAADGEVRRLIDEVEERAQQLGAADIELRRLTHVLEADLHTARSDVTRAQEHAGVLAAEYEAKLRAATAQFQSQTSLLRQRMLITGRLQRELIAATQEKSRLQRELIATSQEKREDERKLEIVSRSRSWRLTAPLRTARAALRRRLRTVRSAVSDVPVDVD